MSTDEQLAQFLLLEGKLSRLMETATWRRALETLKSHERHQVVSALEAYLAALESTLSRKHNA